MRRPAVESSRLLERRHQHITCMVDDRAVGSHQEQRLKRGSCEVEPAPVGGMEEPSEPVTIDVARLFPRVNRSRTEEKCQHGQLGGIGLKSRSYPNAIDLH